MFYISRVHVYIFFFLIILGFNSTAQNFWEKANGPLPWTVISFAVNDQGDLFIGTNGGGVFRSFDNGENWTAINNGVSNETKNVKTLGVAANGIVYAVIENRLYRSTDNGDYWFATNVQNTGSGSASGAILINQKGYIFACLNDLTHGYIYRSRDNGLTWIKLNFVFGTITDLKLNSKGDIIVVGDMQVSTDDGDSWAKMKTGGDSGLNQEPVLDVAVDRNGNIYAGTVRGGIFLSTNNGLWWQEISTGIPKPYSRVTDIEVNARGDIFCVLGDGSVYRSTNGGALWIQVFDGYPDEFWDRYYPLLITPKGTIFKSSRIGLYRSENNGAQWTKIDNSLPSTEAWSLLVDSRGYIYAGLWYGGIFCSTDNGYKWKQIGIGDIQPVTGSILINSIHQLFVGNQGKGIFRSTDDGKTWEHKNTGCDTVIIAMALHPNGHIFVGTSDSGIYRSTDDGDSWIQTNNGLSYKHISSLAVTQSGFIFVTTAWGMYRSSNDGETWIQLLNAPPSPCIIIHPNGNIYCGNFLGQFSYSTDNGDTWISQEIEKDLPWVQSLTYDTHGYIYGGMHKVGRIYRSTDYGFSWTDVSSGLPLVPLESEYLWENVNCIVYNPITGSLFAGNSKGVYRSTQLLTSVNDVKENIPSSIELYQNYPNPFLSTTTIRFSVGTQHVVSLRVYDLLGREVTTLFDGEMEAGVHEIVFQNDKLFSGLYLIKLISGNKMISRVMTVMK